MTIEEAVAATGLPKDEAEFWLEKYDFNRTVMHLEDKKAREWASRTVRISKEIQRSPRRPRQKELVTP